MNCSAQFTSVKLKQLLFTEKPTFPSFKRSADSPFGLSLPFACPIIVTSNQSNVTKGAYGSNPLIEFSVYIVLWFLDPLWQA
jgi:hypothetical protein